MKNYFTKGEVALWGASVTLILAAFLIFDRVNYMTLAASLIGVTSLIFNAKTMKLLSIQDVFLQFFC